ncbi:hypothetical protein ACJMK2_021672 [Sinanodonta woodiana]|uniref:Zasp-like motif domain-containing protein n=1 Tax=Sinanodonta woodiana TaxID=1069815 RepID=A0ABD3TIQ9_SINWO
MTSLQLFPPVDHKPSVPKEWGSGKYKQDVNVFVPGPPTWHYSGKPIDQFYRLTQLKLSNVRSNDELLPEPQASDMGAVLINRTFPAEHPYSGHISRTAIFPKFDSPEDPKRGINARAIQPINAEMPATAYDVKIVHKTKGFGDRREIQALPKESEKRALEWNGETGFNQLVKAHGGRQQYYPIPPKVVTPNLQNRWPEMRVSMRTANALRNMERDQWQTTYDLNHTGIGPSNPKKLDNLGDKIQTLEVYGIEDDTLYPRSINTFDPPRPYQGRIARTLLQKPQNQMPLREESTDYKRKKTLTEIEEDRLWNGKEYVNLPHPREDHEGERWIELEDAAHQIPNLAAVEEAKTKSYPNEPPYKPAEPPSNDEEGYLKTQKDERDKQIQEIEAQNRWKVLESHTPGHAITALNHKMALVSDVEKPPAFYGHEGRYNEERAGLYKTSYIPERLAYSMNALDLSGPELANTFHSHVDALHLPTTLSQDMRDAFRRSRTLNDMPANLSGDRRESRELMNQYISLKEAQKKRLQPTNETARTKVQEKETILKDSTTADSYNVKKFLQENELGKHARNEPLHVMSTENQNLNNVRMTASSKSHKSVSFSDNVTVALAYENGPMRYSSAPTRGSVCEEKQEPFVTTPVNTTQYTSTHALYDKANETTHYSEAKQSTIYNINPKEMEEEDKENTPQQPSFSVSVPKVSKFQRPATSFGDGTEYRDEFGSRSSNFMPANLKNSLSLKTAYEQQFPVYNHIGYKYDPRFSWEPGHGTPRPQTTLLEIQNRFSKSSVIRKFQSQFPENNPDLRENITNGKKHNFYGLSGQVLHG